MNTANFLPKMCDIIKLRPVVLFYLYKRSTIILLFSYHYFIVQSPFVVVYDKEFKIPFLISIDIILQTDSPKLCVITELSQKSFKYFMQLYKRSCHFAHPIVHRLPFCHCLLPRVIKSHFAAMYGHEFKIPQSLISI